MEIEKSGQSPDIKPQYKHRHGCLLMQFGPENLPHNIKNLFINSISKMYTDMIKRRLWLPGRQNNEDKWTSAHITTAWCERP